MTLRGLSGRAKLFPPAPPSAARAHRRRRLCPRALNSNLSGPLTLPEIARVCLLAPPAPIDATKFDRTFVAGVTRRDRHAYAPSVLLPCCFFPFCRSFRGGPQPATSSGGGGWAQRPLSRCRVSNRRW